MADNVVNLGETIEQVAYKLLHDIAAGEGRHLGTPKADRQ